MAAEVDRHHLVVGGQVGDELVPEPVRGAQRAPEQHERARGGTGHAVVQRHGRHAGHASGRTPRLRWPPWEQRTATRPAGRRTGAGSGWSWRHRDRARGRGRRCRALRLARPVRRRRPHADRRRGGAAGAGGVVRRDAPGQRASYVRLPPGGDPGRTRQRGRAGGRLRLPRVRRDPAPGRPAGRRGRPDAGLRRGRPARQRDLAGRALGPARRLAEHARRLPRGAQRHGRVAGRDRGRRSDPGRPGGCARIPLPR